MFPHQLSTHPLSSKKVRDTTATFHPSELLTTFKLRLVTESRLHQASPQATQATTAPSNTAPPDWVTRPRHTAPTSWSLPPGGSGKMSPNQLSLMSSGSRSQSPNSMHIPLAVTKRRPSEHLLFIHDIALRNPVPAVPQIPTISWEKFFSIKKSGLMKTVSRTHFYPTHFEHILQTHSSSLGQGQPTEGPPGNASTCPSSWDFTIGTTSPGLSGHLFRTLGLSSSWDPHPLVFQDATIKGPFALFPDIHLRQYN